MLHPEGLKSLASSGVWRLLARGISHQTKVIAGITKAHDRGTSIRWPLPMRC